MGYEVKEKFELSRLTTFKIGGACEKLYLPETVEDLVEILKELENPLVIAGGSNLLISSQGVKQPVVSTSKLKKLSIEGNRVIAECGVFGAFLAQSVAKVGLTGFEFLVAFPGTVGGNLYMNASAHGQFMSDCFVSMYVYDLEENCVKFLRRQDMKFGYKQSILQTGKYVALRAEFELNKGDEAAIKELMERNLSARKQSQPSMSYPNAGCVFKNPENDSAGRLLDKAGMKGFDGGNVKVWDTHANFVVNKGNASSTDVLELMLKMYNEVKERYSIELVPEVIFVGEKNEREKEICSIIYPKIQK